MGETRSENAQVWLGTLYFCSSDFRCSPFLPITKPMPQNADFGQSWAVLFEDKDGMSKQNVQLKMRGLFCSRRCLSASLTLKRNTFRCSAARLWPPLLIFLNNHGFIALHSKALSQRYREPIQLLCYICRKERIPTNHRLLWALGHCAGTFNRCSGSDGSSGQTRPKWRGHGWFRRCSCISPKQDLQNMVTLILTINLTFIPPQTLIQNHY